MGKITVTRGRKVGCENYGSAESSVTLEMDLEFLDNTGLSEENIRECVVNLQALAERLVEDDLQAGPAVYQGQAQPASPATHQEPYVPDLGAPSQARAPYASNTTTTKSAQKPLPFQPAPQVQPPQGNSSQPPPFKQQVYDDFRVPKVARGFYPWSLKMKAHFHFDEMDNFIKKIEKENGIPWNTREWTDELAQWMGQALVQEIRTLPNYAGEFDK